MYQKITIVGRLGGDPSLQYTKNDKAVTEMSVAVDSGYGDYERTDWFDVTVWGKSAEACNTYLAKGSLVLVDGRMQKDTWDADDGTKRSKWKLIASNVKFLSSKSENKNAEPKPVEEPIPF